jgi:hypothetical protein
MIEDDTMSERELETMALCAIRYTIGRQSYIVSDGQNWARQWGEKSSWIRGVIIRDLRDEVRRCDDGFHTLGDQYDEAGWRQVLEYLESLENK